MKNTKRFLAAALIAALIFTNEAISNAAETQKHLPMRVQE